MVRKGQAEQKAKERITYLYALAEKKLDENLQDSQKAIEMLRKLATKHNLRITEMKQSFCKSCNTLLYPGKTATVRIHDNRRVITCKECGEVKRLGLTSPEQKGAEQNQ